MTRRGSGFESTVAVRLDVPELQQGLNDLVGTLLDRELARIERDLGIQRGLVRVVHAGEAHRLAGGDGVAGLGVEALHVALLADIERGVAEDLNEVPLRHLAGFVASFAIGADHRAEDRAAVLGDQASDVAHATDVRISIFLAEAEPLRQVGPDLVAVEHRGVATVLGQAFGQGVSDGALARSGKAGEPDRQPLVELRRVGLAKDLGNLRAAEPLGQGHALGEIVVADLGTGDVGGLDPFGDLVDGAVPVLVGQVDHQLEIDHAHANFIAILLHEFLGVVRPVEGLARGIVAGAGVVSTDDEMGAAEVAADDRVEEGLARSGHPHRQRQEAEDDRVLVVVVVHQGPIAADTGEVVHVSRLGDTDDRVDEQAAADLLGRELGQFFVGPVQGVSGLEGNDLLPALLGEVGSDLGRGLAEFDEVVVWWDTDDFELAGGVVARLAVQIGDGGVLGVGRAVGPFGLGLLVVCVDFLDMEEGEQVAVDVSEGQRLAFGHSLGGIDGQGDRQGPEGAVGQAHLGDYSLVVGLTHEASKRREAAGGQQFQVTETTFVERQARVLLRGCPHFGGAGVIDDQVNQRSAIGGVGTRMGSRGRNRQGLLLKDSSIGVEPIQNTSES